MVGPDKGMAAAGDGTDCGTASDEVEASDGGTAGDGMEAAGGGRPDSPEPLVDTKCWSNSSEPPVKQA